MNYFTFNFGQQSRALPVKPAGNANNPDVEEIKTLLSVSSLKQTLVLVMKLFLSMVISADALITFFEFIDPETIGMLRMAGVLCVLSAGVFAYTVRSIRGIYKENKREKELVEKANRKLDELFFSKLPKLLTDEKRQSLIQVNHLAAKFSTTITIMTPFLKAKIAKAADYKDSHFDDYQQLLHQVQTGFALSNSFSLSLVLSKPHPLPGRIEAVWIGTKKFFNRLWSFFEGVSLGLTIAAGAIMALSNQQVTFEYLIFEPMGRVVIGLMCALGMGNVVMDYRITREQEERINKLEKIIKKVCEKQSVVISELILELQITNLSTAHLLRQLDVSFQKPISKPIPIPAASPSPSINDTDILIPIPAPDRKSTQSENTVSYTPRMTP